MDNVYRIPPLFRKPARFVLGAAIALDLFFLVVGLGSRTGIALESSLVFIGASAPLLLLLPLYLLYHNSGEIILTDDAVVVRRWGREKRLRYDDVLSVRERDWNLPPNLVLRGPDVTLGIHTQAERFPQLYELLVERVPVLYRRAAERAPLRLEGARRLRNWLIFGIVVLGGFYLGFGLLPIWSELASGAPDFTPVLLRNAFIVFALASFFALPALYIVIVGMVAGSLKGGQPVAYLFTEKSIHYRPPLGRWQRRPADQLAGIYLQSVETTVRASSGGAIVAETVLLHGIILHLANGEVLEISRDRLRHFGQTPNELYARLGRLYPQVPRKEVTAAQLAQGAVFWGARPAVRFPYTLRLKRLALWNGLAVTAFFALCTLGTVLIHLWLIASDDPGAQANGVFWVSMAIWGSVFLALTWGVFATTLHPRQPCKLVFRADLIRFRYPLSCWRIWPATALQGINLETKTMRGVRRRGGRYMPATIRKQMVVLRLTEGRTLTIEADRARQFGLSPAALAGLLRSLYGLED